MWKNILGHKKQRGQLERTLREKKLPHALLFSGIEGIGKRAVALDLIQGLTGETSRERIAKKLHPDVHFIEPSGTTIKIDVIRELKQKLYLHPLEGKAKAVLIDKPETMTEAASNALLKILEEPPQDTYFILVSAQAARLLPTIRSRCQTLDFSPLSENDITAHLQRQGFSAEEAGQRALLSQGSLKAAIECDPEFFEEMKKKLAGLLKEPKPSAIFELSETWSHEDEKIPLLLAALHHLWHEKITGGGATETEFRQWLTLQNAPLQLERHANKQLLFENLLFTLTSR